MYMSTAREQCKKRSLVTMIFTLKGHGNEVVKNHVFYVLPGAMCWPGLLLGTFGPLIRLNHDQKVKTNTAGHSQKQKPHAHLTGHACTTISS